MGVLAHDNYKYKAKLSSCLQLFKLTTKAWYHSVAYLKACGYYLRTQKSIHKISNILNKHTTQYMNNHFKAQVSIQTHTNTYRVNKQGFMVVYQLRCKGFQINQITTRLSYKSFIKTHISRF